MFTEYFFPENVRAVLQ